MNYTRGAAPGGHGLGAKSYKAPTSVPEGHFDPDELTRRLYLVLAEQKAQAERRRKARSDAATRRDGREHASGARHREARQKHAEPSADTVAEPRRTELAEDQPLAGAVRASDVQPGAYHHVPKEAARQFTRTTTVGSMRDGNLVNRLSKHALKFRLEGGPPLATRPGAAGNSAHEPAPTPPPQQTDTQREGLLLERDSQSPRGPAPGGAPARPDRVWGQPTRRQPPAAAAAAARRRNSTGNAADPSASSSAADERAGARRSLLAAAAAPDTLVMDTLLEDVPPPFPPAEYGRVDWTQSDEPPAPPPAPLSPTHVIPADGGGDDNANRNIHHAIATARSGPRLLLLSPLLRKADSLWTLKGRRRESKDSSGSGGTGGGGGGGGDGRLEDTREAGQSPTTPTTPTAGKGGKGFFGRFKR
ncbi:hypothetical protein MYCTH_2312089 [Thermothelomyces thermophilus ATCC 42464]|uniref:Uncharacterized protein n=1 Tax=Thermothelomyces thermophilus (strain ATCC 42464 / BCRC 31852 / DSM 1799) TaxID=573729 RepID=G2QQ24_THET4|nr:uncharacterized protein MYCTH_2312089 [Thermothelomyces thermophilus ATCC 42464]AEO61687.1 hypothetical protein MYCTH_2312089 [Thermothelomyces thermophilus ATCC 42464]